MTGNATQPDQAEGGRDDEPAADAARQRGQGVSATDPAEGSDDAPPGGPGSADG